MSKTLGSSPANTTFAFLMSIVIVIVSMAATTATAEEFLVPESQAFRAGLKVQWSTQLPVGSPYKFLDWCLQIDENSSTTYFVMEAGNVREVVSNRQLNMKGEPYGLQGAKEEIDFRKELLETRLKMRDVKGIDVKVSSYTLPKSVVYTLSNDGVVSAIDADSGNILWKQLIGDNSLTVVGVGASNNHVAVIIGSKVYCLNAADGRTLWSKETVYVPTASPAVSDTNILVPLGNGRLQSFLIEDEGYGSNAFFASGFATTRPLVSGNKVAWATDSGQLNLATPVASKAVSFRLKAQEAIVAAPTSKGNNVYAGSVDGFVYCVDQERGRLVWEVTTGTGVTQPVIPSGDFVFVVSQANSLFKIDAMTGQFAQNWETPVNGIKRFLGATEKSIFALDKANILQVIDKNTGKNISSVPVGSIDKVLTNYQTDRIYLASDDGLIQCVREASSVNPVFYNRDAITPAADGSGTKPNGAAPQEDPFATDGGENPFATDGAGDNPFASDDEPADAGSGTKPNDDEADSDADDDNPFN